MNKREPNPLHNAYEFLGQVMAYNAATYYTADDYGLYCTTTSSGPNEPIIVRVTRLASIPSEDVKFLLQRAEEHHGTLEVHSTGEIHVTF
jgi:hypothetical protein